MMDTVHSRILHVPRRFSLDDWGGTEAVITELCRYQGEHGFRPEIHTSKALNPSEQESWQGIPINRYNHCYPFFGLSKEDIHKLDLKGGNLLSWGLYSALCKARNVRLYHAHVTKRMGGSVLKAAQKNKRPCVVTLHGNMFDVPAQEAESVVDAQQNGFEWGKPFGAYFKSRSLLDEADAVLCVGYSEYEKAKAALNHERVYFLPNGVNPEKFRDPQELRDARRAELEIPDDGILYGCISRIDPQKDQMVLLDAFERYAKENLWAYLLMCGPETVPEYAQRLQQRIEASPFRDRIRHLAPLDSAKEEHAATFAALDVFVLPSRHEPFGIVVLEAWAAGKPVIVSGAGGLDQLVTDNQDGFKFGIGNLDALVEKMKDLAENKSLRAELARAGQCKVFEQYTWDQVGKQLETVYSKVLEKYE